MIEDGDDHDFAVSNGRIRDKVRPPKLSKMGRTPPDFESRYRREREKQIRNKRRNKAK